VPDDPNPLPKEPAAERPASLGQQLSRFVEWVKPYKEIATLLVGAFVAVSAGIAWTISHFATRAALDDLQCQIEHDKGTKAIAESAAAAAAAAGMRHAQIEVLSAQAPSQSTTALTTQWSKEAKNIYDTHAAKVAEDTKKIDTAFADCKRVAASGKGAKSP